MPRDLLLVLGGVLTVGALVDTGAAVALHVVVEDQLVVAGEVTEGAFEWPFLSQRRLVGLQVVVHQLLPLFRCKATAVTTMAEVQFLMVLQLFAGRQSFLTGSTLQVRVLLLDVALEGGLTVANEGAVRTAVGDLLLVLPQGVLLERRLGTETGFAAGAGKVQLPLVAAVNMASDIVLNIAAVVTEWAEVGGLLLVDTQAVNAQLGVGAKGLATNRTGDAAHSGVQGLMGLQAVAPRGAELAVRTLVRLHAFVLDAHVLAQAARLLASEVALTAGQLGARTVVLPVELPVESQGCRSLGSEGAQCAAELTQLQTSPFLVSLQGALLVARERAGGARKALPLVRRG